LLKSRFLIERNVDLLNIIDGFGSTILEHAIIGAPTDIAELILEATALSTKQNDSVLNLAIKYKRHDLVKFLMEKHPELLARDKADLGIVLLWAFHQNNWGIIELIIKTKINLHLFTEESLSLGMSPFFFLARQKKWELLMSLFEKYPEIATIRFCLGNTIVQYLVNEGKWELVERILRLNPDAALVYDLIDKTPLDYARESNNLALLIKENPKLLQRDIGALAYRQFLRQVTPYANLDDVKNFIKKNTQVLIEQAIYHNDNVMITTILLFNPIEVRLENIPENEAYQYYQHIISKSHEEGGSSLNKQIVEHIRNTIQLFETKPIRGKKDNDEKFKELIQTLSLLQDIYESGYGVAVIPIDDLVEKLCLIKSDCYWEPVPQQNLFFAASDGICCQSILENLQKTLSEMSQALETPENDEPRYR
jgi:ankyrin repeat protein